MTQYDHKKWCLKLQLGLMYCLLFGWIPILFVALFYVTPYIIVPLMN